jgi:uncharacterized protein (TIGR02246 family)
MKVKRESLLLTIFILVSGCREKIEISRDSSAAVIDKIYEDFTAAYHNLDVDAVTNLYTEDAHYLAPDTSILIGREVIRSSFARFFDWAKANEAQLKISFKVVDRSISGDLAYDVGYYYLETLFPNSPEKKSRKDVGKFVTVAKRQPDGSWKFHVDGYSSAP